METRDKGLLNLRPLIPSAKILPGTCDIECFQNQILRPLVALQSDLLIVVFRNYLSKHKNVFYDLNIEKKIEYIDSAIQKDFKFRNSLKGIIIGHFTLEEYEQYSENSSNLNKRMMDLIRECLKDNLQVLEFRNAG